MRSWVANTDRVRLAFIHTALRAPESRWTSGARELGRMRWWMTPARGRRRRVAEATLQAAQRRAAAAARPSQQQQRSLLPTQTDQPEDLGRDAGGARAAARGWSRVEGVQHKPTLVQRLQPVRLCGEGAIAGPAKCNECQYTGTLRARSWGYRRRAGALGVRRASHEPASQRRVCAGRREVWVCAAAAHAAAQPPSQVFWSRARGSYRAHERPSVSSDQTRAVGGARSVATSCARMLCSACHGDSRSIYTARLHAWRHVKSSNDPKDWYAMARGPWPLAGVRGTSGPEPFPRESLNGSREER